MRYFWGDLHNHCAISYGHGTLQRALDNARQQLDFCSVTGHAFWPDMPMDLATQNRIIGVHLGGFTKLQYYWKEVLATLEQANIPGKFVTLPSYEWHSMEFGDYNCYFDRFDPELIDHPTRCGLADALRATGKPFMMMPHHIGYPRGHRGINWDAFDPEVSPLIEIFSNHGAGEADDAPGDYHHSMGPRLSESMIREGLLRGYRFGFTAGTDSHDGYPGHYGHGRTGVAAERLELPELWRALRDRQTIASTGAPINAVLHLGDIPIGGSGSATESMPLSGWIEGTGPIERIDWVEGGQGRCRVRRLPAPDLDTTCPTGRFHLKIECGWGREGELSDWEISCHVKEGSLTAIKPCFRHSQYQMQELESTERIIGFESTQAHWRCRAIGNPSGAVGGTHFHAGGTQAVLLELEGGPRTRVAVRSGDLQFELTLETLLRGSVGAPRAGLCSPALKIHRAVPEREFHVELNHQIAPLAGRESPGFAYLRVTQSDGQTAWISPFFYE